MSILIWCRSRRRFDNSFNWFCSVCGRYSTQKHFFLTVLCFFRIHCKIGCLKLSPIANVSQETSVRAYSNVRESCEKNQTSEVVTHFFSCMVLFRTFTSCSSKDSWALSGPYLVLVTVLTTSEYGPRNSHLSCVLHDGPLTATTSKTRYMYRKEPETMLFHLLFLLISQSETMAMKIKSN